MKQSVTVGAQLLWSGRYGCNNGRYGCTIVMSYIEINKAVSQWLLTFNLCVSVTWPLTCAFHIPCTHTPEIIDMHRGMCDNPGCSKHRIHIACIISFMPANLGFIFLPQTYFGVDVDTISDPLRRRALKTMIKTYGQTPKMLFRTAHPVPPARAPRTVNKTPTRAKVTRLI